MACPITPSKQRHSTKPINTPKRAELLAIKKLRDAKKLPLTDRELFEHVGVSRATGYRVFSDQARQFHKNPYCNETRGRLRTLSKAQIDQIIVFLRSEGYEARVLPWVNLCDAAGLDFPGQPPSRRIRYSDEVHFKYGPEGKVMIIRRSGERYNPDCIHYTQRPTEAEDRQICLSAWAAIGWNFKSKLITDGDDFILEEDGASGHGGNSDHNIVKQWKQNHGLNYFFNCPGAPDLAPIENAWRAPKGQVKRHAIWDKDALRTAAEEGWESLSQETINQWVEQVPARLLDVISAKGQYTGH
ncbi:hypothetical protein F5Y19DRAFT_466647 [Xylariaceae sp. FL1651]|nr:hypothetical protein F5Y19DRAFT_466647 [Xylariaceae sp. FL1651]